MNRSDWEDMAKWMHKVERRFVLGALLCLGIGIGVFFALCWRVIF